MSRLLVCLLTFALLLPALTSAPAMAQQDSVVVASEPATVLPPSYQTPPAITLVDGDARLIRQGQGQAASINMPLLEGDRLVTEAGRVEVRFPDGSWLHIDRQSSVDFLSLSLVRLLDGRIIFTAAGRGGERPSAAYQLDAAAGSVQIQAAGEYHVSTYSDGSVPEVELAVVSGSASLMNERGNVQVNAGERSWARAGAGPEYPQAFNSARTDAFAQWSDAQRSGEVGIVSTHYLPSELDGYSGTFDRYGSWESLPEYGHVWYPRVSVGWRPYYNGYWDYVGPYGWTWLGADSWAWPTHHFGRWGVHAGAWFWIPGRHWAPAWVSWAFSASYFSWCALDYYNRPVVNIYGHNYHGGRYGWDHAWTVAPRHAFGRGGRVRVANVAITGSRLAAVERRAFAAGRPAPDAPRAFERAASASRLLGGRTVTRNREVAVPRALSATSSAVARTRTSPEAFPLPRSNAAVSRGIPGQTRGAAGLAARPGTSDEPGGARARSALGAGAPRIDERSLPYAIARGRAGVPGNGSAMPDRSAGIGARAAPGYDRQASPGTTIMRGRPSDLNAGQGARSRGFSPSAPGASPGTQAIPGAAPGVRSRSTPGYDRPSSPPSQALPRGGAPGYSSPRSAPGSSAPRGNTPAAPSRGVSRSYRAADYSPPQSSPRYAPPSRSAPDYAAPRGYGSGPGAPSSGVPRSYAAPDYSPRYSASQSPRYAPPSRSAPDYAAPRGYSAPASPRGYSAPSATSPRGYYSAPASPRGYSAPSGPPSGYSAPASPRGGYGAPSAPSRGYSAPSPGGSAAPRGGAGVASPRGGGGGGGGSAAPPQRGSRGRG